MYVTLHTAVIAGVVVFLVVTMLAMALRDAQTRLQRAVHAAQDLRRTVTTLRRQVDGLVERIERPEVARARWGGGPDPSTQRDTASLQRRLAENLALRRHCEHLETRVEELEEELSQISRRGEV
jgi:hypothetical protein